MIAARLAGLLRRPADTGGRLARSLLGIRVLRTVLWLVVVSGPVAAGVLALQVSALRHRVEVVSRQAVVELPADSAGAEGFAELFVASFLSAGEGSPETLAAFLDVLSLGGMEEGLWVVSRTVSLGAREVAPGYFAVTVAAEVVARDVDSMAQPTWVPVGTLFYTVGVTESGSGWAAVGLPALVAAPPTGSTPDLVVRRMDGLREVSGLEEAVTRFLVAYLTGEGELARYTAPGSPLIAVQPPPFVAVEMIEAGSVAGADGARQVVVLVAGTDEAGRTQVLQYALVAAERDGRWEVAELLPAPPLAAAGNN